MNLLPPPVGAFLGRLSRDLNVLIFGPVFFEQRVFRTCLPFDLSREAPCSNAFSPILDSTESSVFVADSLLEPPPRRKGFPLRFFWVYSVVSSEVFEVMSATGSMKRVVAYSAVGILFSHTDEKTTSVSTFLPFGYSLSGIIWLFGK